MGTIPSYSELYALILADFTERYGTALPAVQSVFIKAWAGVLAMAQRLIYLSMAKVQQNIMPDKCDYPTLLRWGKLKLNRYPYTSTQGQYTLTVTGEVGAVIPASSTWTSDGTSANPGKYYVLDDSFTMTATTDTILVRALEAGSASELEIGNTLTANAPILNVNREATVEGIYLPPYDGETEAEYRAKVIQAFQVMGQVGSAADYRIWGTEGLGVKQIYAYAYSGHANEALVFVEGETYGTPAGGAVITAAELGIEARRPLTVFEIHYAACPILEIVIDITQIAILTVDQKTVVENALRNEINLVRPFIAAADVVANRNDSVATDYSLPYCTNLYSVVATAIPGVPVGAITFTVDGTPETAYNFDLGNIPYVTTVNFV